jgi:hypothetical protein
MDKPSRAKPSRIVWNQVCHTRPIRVDCADLRDGTAATASHDPFTRSMGAEFGITRRGRLWRQLSLPLPKMGRVRPHAPHLAKTCARVCRRRCTGVSASHEKSEQRVRGLQDAERMCLGDVRDDAGGDDRRVVIGSLHVFALVVCKCRCTRASASQKIDREIRSLPERSRGGVRLWVRIRERAATE